MSKENLGENFGKAMSVYIQETTHLVNILSQILTNHKEGKDINWEQHESEFKMSFLNYVFSSSQIAMLILEEEAEEARKSWNEDTGESNE